ncbi:MAG TPA: FAD binding domain-containing protein, partial [Chloroflexota bacterium]|nr:FAD binding domain-containing protein [Chloroflexota bacterium]
MRPFQLHRPGTLDEVLTLLEEHGPDETHVLAGGTSLVLLMNLGLVQPGHVVSLREVAELHGTQRLPDGGIVLRAMATHRQLEQSVDVAAFCPALTETFGHVATVRIRNQATVGGNVVHADPAQDPPAMLVALDAEAVIRSRAGQRIIPLESLFVGYLTTSLTDGEVLTE